MRLPPQADPVPIQDGDSRERLIQRLTEERYEARESRDYWEAAHAKAAASRDEARRELAIVHEIGARAAVRAAEAEVALLEARARADRLSDLLARERLLRDLLLAEVREMRATWRQD